MKSSYSHLNGTRWHGAMVVKPVHTQVRSLGRPRSSPIYLASNTGSLQHRVCNLQRVVAIDGLITPKTVLIPKRGSDSDCATN